MPEKSFIPNRREALKLTGGVCLAAAMAHRVLGQAKQNSPSQKFLGVTVLPEYIQSEGIDGVLKNLKEVVGATAVATSPYVMEEADRKTGLREPPADAGKGLKRLLDRPLFGKREVWVRTAPSFQPKAALYQGLRYQPSEATDLTRREGPIVADFVKAAKQAGLKVYFQIQAAIPPCYRVQFGGPVDDDQPTLPSGRALSQKVAKNGSLASEHILRYEHALIRDLYSQYPELDGIRYDWPEYPPYFLDSVFVDFCPHAERAAFRYGFDFDRMRREVGQLYDKLHGGLANSDLEPLLAGDGGRFAILRDLANSPGVSDWLRFKAVLVEQMLEGFRKVTTAAAGDDKEVMPNAFPPPFTLVSGLDFGRAGKYSSAISSKLYTMHWEMILRNYGDQLLKANPDLSNPLLTKVLVKMLDITDEPVGEKRLEDYEYPGPEEPHLAGPKTQARKIRQAQAEAGDTPVYTLAHGYGPIDDYRARLKTAWDASDYGMWMNRYAYLTDEKLEIIGDVARS